MLRVSTDVGRSDAVGGPLYLDTQVSCGEFTEAGLHDQRGFRLAHLLQSRIPADADSEAQKPPVLAGNVGTDKVCYRLTGSALRGTGAEWNNE